MPRGVYDRSKTKAKKQVEETAASAPTPKKTAKKKAESAVKIMPRVSEERIRDMKKVLTRDNITKKYYVMCPELDHIILETNDYYEACDTMSMAPAPDARYFYMVFGNKHYDKN